MKIGRRADDEFCATILVLYNFIYSSVIFFTLRKFATRIIPTLRTTDMATTSFAAALARKIACYTIFHTKRQSTLSFFSSSSNASTIQYPRSQAFSFHIQTLRQTLASVPRFRTFQHNFYTPCISIAVFQYVETLNDSLYFTH